MPEGIGDARTQPLLPGHRMPLLVQPTQGSPELVGWAREHRAAIEEALRAAGALLFRGFQAAPATGLGAFIEAVSSGPLEYVYRSTPRTAVGAGVYTATEYPASATIPLHTENAYQRSWPMKLAFQAVQVAQQGGETPLADMLRVTRRLGEERVERFSRLGVLYVRNYGQSLDLPWQTVFQTQERAEVERYCREHGLEAQWLSGGRLRTRQVCQGTAVHPVTGERVWFNQAHLFHITSLDPKTREALLELFREEELPRQTYLGDGSPLAPEELDAIREAFAQEEVAFPWQAGDVLLVDNMQVAHGRRPFSGPRKVLVAMADPYSPSWPPAGMRQASPGKS